MVYDAGGNPLQTVVWTRSDAQAWQEVTADLSALAGQAVTLLFGVYNDGASGRTAMYVDDVALEVCPGPVAYLPVLLVYSPPMPCSEWFVNPGFETAAGWEIRPNPVPAEYATYPVHSGQQSIRTGIRYGGLNVESYSPVQQTVDFTTGSAAPTGGAAAADVPAVPWATLSFWHFNIYLDSSAAAAALPAPESLPRTLGELPGATLAADFFYAIAIYEDDTIDWLLVERLQAPEWRQTVVDVSRYKNHIMRFQFGTYNNGVGGASRTYVDDASLWVCPDGGGVPTYTPTPTPTSTPSPTSTPTSTPTATPSPTPTGTASPTNTPTRTPTPVVPAGLPYLRQTLALPTDTYPSGVAVKPDGQKIYMAAQVGKLSKLDVLAAEPLAVTTQIPLGAQETAPNGVALVDTTGRVAVALRDTANAWVVNAETGSQVASITANWLPNGVAVHDGYGYIANYGNDTITVFDPATLAVVNTLYVGHEPSHFAATGGADLFASMHGNGEIVRLRNGLVAGHVYGIASPYGLAYEAATARLFVANRGVSQSVTVLDGPSGAVLATIPTGQETYVLAVNPNTGRLFVACGDRVKVYRTSDLAFLTQIAVPSGAEEGIAVDPVKNRVYVTSRSGRALSVIQDVAPPPPAPGLGEQLWSWVRGLWAK